MANWYDYLTNGLLLAGCGFAVRELLIAIVSLWSMGTKSKDRRGHALKLLKLLKVQIRQPPAEIPPVEQLPPKKDPPIGPPSEGATA